MTTTAGLEPLHGIRVVEAGIAVIGPVAGVFLADMGAEVIKIEPPLGDTTRYVRGVHNDLPPEVPGPMMVAVNRGKKSVRLDLKSPEGRAAAHDLVATADVFLTNFRDAGLRNMGLDYETVHALAPRLVYASSSGFGRRGPDASTAMLDLAVQARGGLVGVTGATSEAPFPVGSAIGDTAAGMLLALGVMTALVARERFGVGQRVDTSALGAQLLLQAPDLDYTAMTGQSLTRQGRHNINTFGLYGVYETFDGRALALCAIGPDDWADFCTFVGEPALIEHELWGDAITRHGFGGGIADVSELRDFLRTAVRSRRLDEHIAFLRDRPNIIYGVGQTYDEVLRDPQVVANGYLADIDLGDVGLRRVIGNVVELSETPTVSKMSVPGLGEHTAVIFRELGYQGERLDKLV